jgi:hypothetical protein
VATTHVATTELPACKSTATTKSTATEVAAAAKAAGVASTKTAAVASAAATMTTTASTATGEGVSLDRGRANGDDRENDCYFAQHKLSFYGRTCILEFFPTRHASPRVLVGLPVNVGTGLLRVCARLPRLFECCGNRRLHELGAHAVPRRPAA